MSLSAALDTYYSQGGGRKRVFAREARGGARTYTLMTPEEAWDETDSPSPTHLYEVLAGPCSLYVDVEWKESEKPDAAEELKKVHCVAAAAQRGVKQQYNVDSTHTLVTASGILPCGKYKASWHIHFHTPGLAWRSASEVGEFVKAHLGNYGIVDKVPYKAPKQNWRCVGSSKHSEPTRTLRPVSKQAFFDCLVQTEGGAVPIAGTPVTRQPAFSSELCDIMAMFPNTRTDAAMWADESKRYLVLPFLKQVCPVANRVHTSNHQYAVIDVAGMRWRHKCHNESCAAAPIEWQPMPCFARGEQFLAQHCTKPRPVAVAAPEGTVPDKSLRRSRGPPPACAFNGQCRAIKCTNGVFVLRQ